MPLHHQIGDFVLATTIIGYAFSVVLIPRLILEHRNPSSSIAWVMSMLLIPAIGVPAYLVLGERSIRKDMKKKGVGAVIDFHPPEAHLPHAALGPLAETCARVLSATGAAEPIDGNRVRFLRSGEEAFDAVLALINSAQDHVHAQFYVLSGDPVGRRFLQALSAAAKRGVEVRLLIDGAGSIGAIRRSIRTLQEAGGRVAIFLPIFPLGKRWSSHLRNHRKMLVVDGHSAFTGGMNVGLTYMGVRPLATRWRDSALLLEGPAVADLQAAFLDDWAFASDEDGPAPGELPCIDDPRRDRLPGSPVQIAVSGPDRFLRPIHQGLFAIMSQAARRIWIQTPYFIPDEPTAAAMHSAALRGVDVRLMVPDVSRSNFWPVAMAGRSYCREAARMGVKVLVYMPTHLHSKIVVIDDEVALVGSSNMDMRSFFLNFELGLFLYGGQDVRAAAGLFLEDAASAVPFNERFSDIPSFKTRLMEDTCRIFSPLF